MQSGIFGLAGRFPPIYTQAVMSGQGIAGVIVSVTSLITALSITCNGHEDMKSSLGTSNTSQSNTTKMTAGIQLGAFEYFLASTIAVIVTIIAFLYLSWSDFGKFYAFGHNDEYDEIEELNEKGQKNRTARDELEGLPPSSLMDNELDESLLEDLSHLSPTSRSRSYSLLRQQSILDSPVFHSRSAGGSSNSVCSNQSHDGNDNNEETSRNDVETLPTCTLISLIGRHCFSVCFTFVVTLSVFPGITSEIRSERNPNNAICPTNGVSRFPYGAGVWQATFFLIFNIGDTLGRALASLGSGFVPHRWLWLVSIFRVVFIPLLLLCNLNTGSTSTGSGNKKNNSITVPSSSPSSVDQYNHYVDHYVDSSHWIDVQDTLPTPMNYFADDVYPLCFMCLLAVSNGFVASLEMMHTPNLVPKSEASRAGAIMAFFLVMGLVLGSVCSFGVRAIACNCNPFVAY